MGRGEALGDSFSSGFALIVLLFNPILGKSSLKTQIPVELHRKDWLLITQPLPISALFVMIRVAQIV